MLHVAVHTRGLPDTFWIAVTVLASVVAVVLITTIIPYAWDIAASLWRRIRVNEAEVGAVFLIFCAVIYFIPFVPGNFMSGRYALPAIPHIAAGFLSVCGRQDESLSAGTVSRCFRVSAFALLIATSLFAIFGTHNYLAWNRVRWEALRDRMRDDIGPDDIGGKN